MIRVVLPFHLRNLARVEGEVLLEVPPPITIAAVLDTLEARFPVLRGTIRDHGTLKRRPFIRFFACKEDAAARGGGQWERAIPRRRRDGGGMTRNA
jgi:sulfur-carrier protein